MRIAGHVDGIVGEGITGWVCAPEQTETRLWVELLVNDCTVAVGRAENVHPDAAAYGDGCYGFWLALPPVIRETGGTLRVRIANTEHFLSPPVRLEANHPRSALQGEVVNNMGLTLSGWVLDTDEPQRKVEISVWLKGERLRQCIADGPGYRPLHSDGHSFCISLPLELADGREHVLDVKDDRNRSLPGSPVLVCLVPEGLTQWFERQKKLEKPEREMLRLFLQYYEAWLPKGLRLEDYPQWRACFPPQKFSLAGRMNVGICLASKGEDTKAALPPQEQRSFPVYACDKTASEEKPLLAALREAAGKHEYVLWLDVGDKLLPGAIAHFLGAARTGQAALVYADSETRLPGQDLTPVFRPAWDPYAFYGVDYLGPLFIASSLIRNLLDGKAPLPDEPDALRARLLFTAEARGIRHLPLVLSEIPAERPQSLERRECIRQQLASVVPNVRVLPFSEVPHCNQITWPLTHTPLVSLIIPTRDKASLLRACLKSLEKGTYRHMEILVVDNASSEPDALRLLEELDGKDIRVFSYPAPFNYAAINNFAARQAKGELLCFLNNDTEVLTPNWLEEMLGPLLCDRSVGAVGAKLLWPNHLAQHSGVVVGTHQLAAHVGNQWADTDQGYRWRNLITQQWSAVTAACLLTPTELFLESGGFDPVCFPVTFNDVDYCLRLRAKAKKIVWTPHAKLMHHESASRGRDVLPHQKARAAMEMHCFRVRWGQYEDPFYNPNLSLSTVLEPFAGLALPPRLRSIR